jgi:hypothetical protein
VGRFMPPNFPPMPSGCVHTSGTLYLRRPGFKGLGFRQLHRVHSLGLTVLGWRVGVRV